MTELFEDIDEAINDIVLLNNFYIKKKRYKVYLNQGVLLWELDTYPHCRTSICVEDIFAVDFWAKDSGSCCSQTDNLENFKISYACKKKENKWRCQHIIFQNSDQKLVVKWVSILKSSIQSLTWRPKRLMMFVNPYGGKKQGVSIFKNIVKPLLDIANIEVDLTITQRAQHARDTINATEIKDFDGIVCIGGDGTFSEVMHAVLYQAAKEDGVNIKNANTAIPPAKIRIGVIPGGSTDSLAYCLHGTCDVQTAVIHIIIGRTTGLDVSSVHNGVDLCSFFTTIMSYGFLGDVLKSSEKMRYLGPKRYDVAGLIHFIKNRGYDVDLTILKQQMTAGSDTKCLKDCKRCETPTKHSKKITDPKAWTKIHGKYWFITAANVASACPRSPNGVAPYCHLGDGYLDLVMVKHGSVWNNIKFLLTISNKKKTVCDLPFVEIYRTRQFKLEAAPERCRSSDMSCWNCDGEIIDEPTIRVQTHRQVLNVFYRGIEQTLPKTKRRFFCCC